MFRALVLCIGLLITAGLADVAFAQNVQQSGTVTPGHPVKWVTSGVVADAGTSTTPGLTGVGILSSQSCSLGINTGTNPAPDNLLCFGVVPGQFAQISLLALGGAPQIPLQFNINGTVYQFPFAIGGIVGPASSTVGNLACWNNTSGSLLRDCGGGNANVGTFGNSTTIPNFTVNSNGLITAAGQSAITNTSALTGGVSRTLNSKLGDIVSVKDFGAVCDGAHPTQDTAAFLAAYSAMLTNSDFRGGTLLVPAGHCNVTQTLAATAFDLVVGLYIQGAGVLATTVDFTGIAPNSDGFTFAHGTQFGISDMDIQSATRDCISVNPGDAISGGTNADHFQFERLRVQFCGRDGKREVNTFLSTTEDSWFNANTGVGENYLGGHTTTINRRVFAASNGGDGFSIYGMISSSWISGSADSNGQNGYAMGNLHAVTFQDTDCEANTLNCFFVNEGSATGLPTSFLGTYGLSFSNVFGFDNSHGSPGAQDGLFAFAPGPHGANIRVEGCTYADDQGGSPAAASYNATGGALTILSIDCSNFAGASVSTFGPVALTTEDTGSLTLFKGIVGNTAGSDPAANFVGTTLSTASVPCTTTTGLTTGTAANVASLTVPAGNWDIEGIVGAAPAASTVLNLVSGAISTTSGSLGITNGGLGRYQVLPGTLAGNSFEQSTGKRHFNFTTPTSVFLVVSANFTTSTAGACGQMIATQTM